jgi:hypothetical protein
LRHEFLLLSTPQFIPPHDKIECIIVISYFSTIPIMDAT